MAKCDHSGNDYDKTFEVRCDGKSHLISVTPLVR